MKDSTQYLLEKYNGKRVFVTGHTGFKGSWLLLLLKRLGAIIGGYSLAPEPRNLYLAINGNDYCTSTIGDICDKVKFEKVLLDFRPDFLFHLAAQPLVRKSYEAPTETFMVNAAGTALVLDAVRKLDQPCTIIAVTTDKVYENMEWPHAYRENDRLGGYDPYSASKACSEIIVSSYRDSFFNPKTYSAHGKAIASARAGNVIGGGDWAKDRLIPDIVRALSIGKPVNIRNQKSIRPWQHVLDPLMGYLSLGAKLLENSSLYSSAWNFGPAATENYTVEEIASMATNAWGEGVHNVVDAIDHFHEASTLKLDISKTTGMLGWYPKLSTQQAVAMSIKWYKSYIRGEKASKLIYSDIDTFFSL